MKKKKPKKKINQEWDEKETFDWYSSFTSESQMYSLIRTPFLTCTLQAN